MVKNDRFALRLHIHFLIHVYENSFNSFFKLQRTQIVKKQFEKCIELTVNHVYFVKIQGHIYICTDVCIKQLCSYMHIQFSNIQ